MPLGTPNENTNSRWAFYVAQMAWVQVDDTDEGAMYFPVPTPIKGLITELLAEIDGNAGPGVASHAARPGTMPTITLYRLEYSATGSELTAVGNDTDAPLDAAAYDSPHTFGPTGMSEAIDANRSYFVKFTGEAGANKLPDELLLASIKVKIEAVP